MATNKQSKCWPGYERVKGKKPNSQGSCRPKPESKLTDSEKAFRAKRKRQLKKWQAAHPSSRKSAAQHLRAPGAKIKKSTPQSNEPQTATKKASASNAKKSK